jgi:hypothetical protein
MGKALGIIHLEDRAEDGRMTLRWMLERYRLGVWNWLRFVSGGGLWY